MTSSMWLTWEQTGEPWPCSWPVIHAAENSMPTRSMKPWESPNTEVSAKMMNEGGGQVSSLLSILSISFVRLMSKQMAIL